MFRSLRCLLSLVWVLFVLGGCAAGGGAEPPQAPQAAAPVMEADAQGAPGAEPAAAAFQAPPPEALDGAGLLAAPAAAPPPAPESGSGAEAASSAAPAKTAPAAEQPRPTATLEAAGDEEAREVGATESEGSAAETGSATGVQVPAPRPQQMLDIEAQLDVEVEDVQEATESLRTMVEGRQGQVIEEAVTGAEGARQARLVVRVPVQAAHDFLAALEELGAVRARNLVVRDIGKQYFDATLRLENLQLTLARYQQLLARAQNVQEIMSIEARLSEVRGQIEQIKGELRWMRDRAARATVTVMLHSTGTYVEPIVRPEARFYPGLRASYLGDFRGDDGRAGYLGAGLSLRFSRYFSLDLEGLRGTDSDTSGLDLFLLTAGGEFYSEFMGEGNREWFNPYLGFRAGYARFLRRNEAAAGGVVGVEILRTEVVTVEAETRVYGFFGSSAGGHLGVQPALGVNVAF